MDGHPRRSPEATEASSRAEQPSPDDRHRESRSSDDASRREPTRADESADLRARMMRDDTFARLEHLRPEAPIRADSESSNSQSDAPQPASRGAADGDREESQQRHSADLRAELRQHFVHLGPGATESGEATPDSVDRAPSQESEPHRDDQAADDSRAQPSGSGHGQPADSASFGDGVRKDAATARPAVENQKTCQADNRKDVEASDPKATADREDEPHGAKADESAHQRTAADPPLDREVRTPTESSQSPGERVEESAEHAGDRVARPEQEVEQLERGGRSETATSEVLPAVERPGGPEQRADVEIVSPGNLPSDQGTPAEPSSQTAANDRRETITTQVDRDDGRPDRSETVRDLRGALADHHPDVADVVERLLADDKHPLDLVFNLNDRVRRPAALATIRELADERLLAGRGLHEFTAENPGQGPLFSPTPRDLNHHDDGQSRKATYVAHCKRVDPARTVGAEPSVEERSLVSDYSRRLVDEVAPLVHVEVGHSARAADGAMSIRAKDDFGLLDKVVRMAEGTDGRPGRTDYQVGDVIDAVGARIVVSDTVRLERLVSEVRDRFGTGDGGRILEMENMYSSPKPHNPSYRVVPFIIAVEVDGKPYTFELQLCTWRASIASDLEHNTVYKPYVRPTHGEQEKVRRMQAEAAALDQNETRSRWHV